MVVAGVAVNNVLPGRVGDLLRARWVSRGAFSGGRGLATVVIDRGFDILALAVFLLATLPFVTDAGLGRPHRGRHAPRARGARRRRAGVTLVRPAAARASARIRGPRRGASCATRSTGSPIRWRRLRARGSSCCFSLAAWLTWAVAAIARRRSVGIELTVVQALFVTAALNLGVAIPSSPGFVGTYQWLGVSALALFGVSREAGLAFAIVMQAVWYVPTTLVGAVLLAAHARRAWRSDGHSSPSGRWIRPS